MTEEKLPEEKLPELVGKVADWMGVYGDCKATCPTDCLMCEEDAVWCRMGFIQELEARIRKAIESENAPTAA